MAFRFRLETVLQWKRSACDTEHLKTKQLVTACKQTEVALKTLDSECLRVSAEVMASRIIDGAGLQTLSAWRVRVSRTRGTLVSKGDDLQRQLAAQRERWIQSRREALLYEKVRQRRKAEYDYEEARSFETTANECYLAQWSSGREVGR